MLVLLMLVLLMLPGVGVVDDVDVGVVVHIVVDVDTDIDRFYIALFSTPEQTHCTFIACDSKGATVAFYSPF